MLPVLYLTYALLTIEEMYMALLVIIWGSKRITNLTYPVFLRTNGKILTFCEVMEFYEIISYFYLSTYHSPFSEPKHIMYNSMHYTNQH